MTTCLTAGNTVTGKTFSRSAGFRSPQVTRPSDRRRTRLDVYCRPRTRHAHTLSSPVGGRGGGGAANTGGAGGETLNRPVRPTVRGTHYARCIVRRCTMGIRSVHSVGGRARWSSTEPVRCRPTRTRSSVYNCWAAVAVDGETRGGGEGEGGGGHAVQTHKTYASVRTCRIGSDDILYHCSSGTTSIGMSCGDIRTASENVELKRIPTTFELFDFVNRGCYRIILFHDNGFGKYRGDLNILNGPTVQVGYSFEKQKDEHVDESSCIHSISQWYRTPEVDRILRVHYVPSFLDPERSDEYIDFTMMCVITSQNNASISNIGGGFRWQSEYPWCIIEFKKKKREKQKKVTEKREFLRKTNFRPNSLELKI
ncbi:Uncharacterized protein FWK35_00017185 [Aphis craccivora]|uniref:Uncharacterized protein n=1 Tax=Aphis craccivora TaxID=307492 RepID=A0A6G0XZ97_APHCR|nr:Uncharacterized protein FWK35_00017185 [Aphis craccivora]